MSSSILPLSPEHARPAAFTYITALWLALLGNSYMRPAMGSAILAFTNVICINLAGVVTFLVQGIRPRNWWEEGNAREATRIALATWVVPLLIFATIIWFRSQGA